MYADTDSRPDQILLGGGMRSLTSVGYIVDTDRILEVPEWFTVAFLGNFSIIFSW